MNSIERALEVHRKRGTIEDWTTVTDGPVVTWVVVDRALGVLRFSNVEIKAFTTALAIAHRAEMNRHPEAFMPGGRCAS